MKKDAYEDLVKEISKKLSEKILQEEGDLTGRIKTIDADIAVIVREVGLRTSKLVIEKTRDEKVAKKSPRIEPQQKQCDRLPCHIREHGTELPLPVDERREIETAVGRHGHQASWSDRNGQSCSDGLRNRAFFCPSQ